MTQWWSIVLAIACVLLDSEHSLAAESKSQPDSHRGLNIHVCIYIGCSSVGDVRLVESPYSGTVQYCYSASGDTGEWIGVCSMEDTATLSQIVCRQVLSNSTEDDGMRLLYAGGDIYSDHILQIFTLSTSLLNSRLQTYSCSAVGHSSLLVRVPSIPAHHVLALTLHAEVGWSSLPFTLYMSPLAGACNSGRCDCTEGWSGLNCRDRQYTCMHTSPLIHMYVSSHVYSLLQSSVC